MSANQRFCTQCGAPLPADARFCGSCGRAVTAAPANAEVASSLAAPFAATAQQGPPPPAPAAVQAPPPPPPAMPVAKALRRRRTSVLGYIIIWGVGLLLIFFGLRGVILQTAGVRTVATVTSVGDGEEDNTYVVNYAFTAPNGKRMVGATGEREYMAGNLPQEGSHVTIYYLAAAPFINAPVSESTFSLGSLLAIGIGVLVILFGRGATLRLGLFSKDED